MKFRQKRVFTSKYAINDRDVASHSENNDGRNSMIIQNSKILHLAQDTWLTAEELRALNPMQYFEFTMKQKLKKIIQSAAKGIKDACDMKNSKMHN